MSNTKYSPKGLYNQYYQNSKMNEAVKGVKDLYNTDGGTRGFMPSSASFYMNGKVTVAMLFLFFFITASNQFFGDIIDCALDDTEATGFNFEKFCLSKSTFTMDYNKARDVMTKRSQDYSVEAINNGLYYKNGTWYLKSNGRPVMLHRAYRWICLSFLLQAFIFYIPTLIWKVFGGQDKLNDLLKMADNKEKLLKHLVDRRKNGYLGCSLFFTFCEILNLVCVIGQFIAVNYFWTESIHGLDLIKWIWTDPNHQDEAMNALFPFETKCLMFHVGPSGTYQRLGGRCLLNFNPIYHKMFTFLWLWSAFLIVITILNLFYRFFMMISVPSVRIKSLKSKATSVPFNQMILAVGLKCFYGDWFMFTFLADHMDRMEFSELMNDLTYDRVDLPLSV